MSVTPWRRFMVHAATAGVVPSSVMPTIDRAERARFTIFIGTTATPMTMTGRDSCQDQTRATARSMRSTLQRRGFAHSSHELPESLRQATTFVLGEKSAHFARAPMRLDHEPAGAQRRLRVAQFNRRPVAWKYQASGLTESTAL